MPWQIINWITISMQMLVIPFIFRLDNCRTNINNFKSNSLAELAVILGAQVTGQAECYHTDWQKRHARISSTTKCALFNHSNEAIWCSLSNFSSYSDWVSIPALAPGLIFSWGCNVGGARDRTSGLRQAECPHTDWQRRHLEGLLEAEKMSLLLKYLETTCLHARTGQDLDISFLLHVHVLQWNCTEVDDNIDK